jgi:hypothetical protein
MCSHPAGWRPSFSGCVVGKAIRLAASFDLALDEGREQRPKPSASSSLSPIVCLNRAAFESSDRLLSLNNASNPDRIVMGLDQTLTCEKSMIKPNETKLTKLPIPPLVPASGDGDDRQAFSYLIIFLLACLERIITDRASAAKPQYKWLEEWSDEDYFYLETHIPDDSSGMEIDLNVTNGLIYARIARTTDGNMNSEPPAH